MTRFNETKVDSTNGTVEVGAGLTCGQVYAILEPTKRYWGAYTGRRCPTLAEVSLLHRPRARSDMLLGYSFKTSQYGLTVDNVAGFELVLPNGTITSVASKDEELWFGLRVSRKTRY